MGEPQLFHQLGLRLYFSVLKVVNNVIVYYFKDYILQFCFLGAKVLEMQMGSKRMAKLPSLKMRAVYIPTRSVGACHPVPSQASFMPKVFPIYELGLTMPFYHFTGCHGPFVPRNINTFEYVA